MVARRPDLARLAPAGYLGLLALAGYLGLLVVLGPPSLVPVARRVPRPVPRRRPSLLALTQRT